MDKQYCKVGAITPMTTGRKAIALLEYQYQNFMEKASTETNLSEYFEEKAKKIQRILENLV